MMNDIEQEPFKYVETVEYDDVPAWGSSSVRDALLEATENGRKARITVEEIQNE